MYYIYYGEENLHDYIATDSTIQDASLEFGTNKIPYFDFSITQAHPLYNTIKELDYEKPIVVYDDDEIIFSGIIYSIGNDFERIKSIKCKGDISFLNECIVPPYSTIENVFALTAPNDIALYFKWLIDTYNTIAPQNKRFIVGIDESDKISPNNTHLYRKSFTRPTFYNEINEKILEPFGCTIRTRNVNGNRYLDLIYSEKKINNQIIDISENLLGFESENTVDDICTCVIPTGPNLSESGYFYNDGYMVAPPYKFEPLQTYYKLVLDSGEPTYIEASVVPGDIPEKNTQYYVESTNNKIPMKMTYAKAGTIYYIYAPYIQDNFKYIQIGVGVDNGKIKTFDDKIIDVDPEVTYYETYAKYPNDPWVMTLAKATMFRANVTYYRFMNGAYEPFSYSVDTPVPTYENIVYYQDKPDNLKNYVPASLGSTYKFNPNEIYYVISEDGYYTEIDQVTTAWDSSLTYYVYNSAYDESDLPLTIKEPMSASLKNEIPDGYFEGSDRYYIFGESVCDMNAVSKYGYIYQTLSVNDATSRRSLVKSAIEHLELNSLPNTTIEIKAMDLHLINPKRYSGIKIGEFVRVRSEIHGIDSYYICSSIDLDLNDPANTIYNFGYEPKTLTKQQKALYDEVNSTINRAIDERSRINVEGLMLGTVKPSIDEGDTPIEGGSGGQSGYLKTLWDRNTDYRPEEDDIPEIGVVKLFPPVDSLKTGIVLCFGTNTNEEEYLYFHIPKNHLLTPNSSRLHCSDAYWGLDMHFTLDRFGLNGDEDNASSGEHNGIAYNNGNYYLRWVLEY